MIDSTSRYARIAIGSYVSPDGRTVTYVKRRFLPKRGAINPISHVTTRQGDRLDLISQRVFGTAAASWRLADSNEAMDPSKLLKVDRVLIVGMPES